MMHAVCLGVLLFILGSKGDEIPIPLQLFKGFEVQAPGNRDQRSAGIAQINRLLQQSRHIFSDGLNDVYMRPGTYAEALGDFKALRPDKIKESNRFGKKSAQGNIGLRRIVVKETESGPVLTITQNPERNAIRVDPVIWKTIVYKNDEVP